MKGDCAREKKNEAFRPMGFKDNNNNLLKGSDEVKCSAVQCSAVAPFAKS